MEIYWFSGTGNSLHVARELQGRFPGSELIPIVRLLSRGSAVASAEAVGFVFPIHLTSLPYPVRDFIEELDVSSARYIFAAATSMGTFCLADIHLERILRRKGKSLGAFFVLNMTGNSPCGLMPRGVPGFEKMVSGWADSLAPERVQALEAEMWSRLELIRGIIGARGNHREGRSPVRTAAKRLAASVMSLTDRSTRRQTVPFYVDSDCVGCGLCERVCLSGRIALAGGVPVWKPETPCYFCYACFNCCPEQAILVRDRYTGKKGRYLHADIGPEDIAGQK